MWYEEDVEMWYEEGSAAVQAFLNVEILIIFLFAVSFCVRFPVII